jgi:hypothetical protein
MQVDVFDENFENLILTINFLNLYTDFTMKLENMLLITDWKSITMEKARVESSLNL